MLVRVPRPELPPENHARELSIHGHETVTVNETTDQRDFGFEVVGPNGADPNRLLSIK